MIGELIELILRLEKAEGPDVDLDRIERDIDRWAREAGIHKSRGMLRYTRSIDAALTLVPEEWVWSLDRHGYIEGVYQNGAGARLRPPWSSSFTNGVAGFHKVPAIALTIAALRARETADG